MAGRNGRKPHARFKMQPTGVRHRYSPSDWRVDPRYGQYVYHELLGPLEEREMHLLAARSTTQARRYCRTVYGREGGEYAWRQYLKWKLTKESIK